MVLRLKLSNWPSSTALQLYELFYVANKETLYVFCRNDTKRAIFPIQDWSEKSQSFASQTGSRSCTSRSMHMSMIKTHEDATFAFDWMKKNNKTIMQIRGTFIR